MIHESIAYLLNMWTSFTVGFGSRRLCKNQSIPQGLNGSEPEQHEQQQCPIIMAEDLKRLKACRHHRVSSAAVVWRPTDDDDEERRGGP